MHQTHAGHTNSPERHDSWNEYRRPETLEEDVREWFEACIGQKEEGERGIVFTGREVEIIRQALDLRIADVGAILNEILVCGWTPSITG